MTYKIRNKQLPWEYRHHWQVQWQFWTYSQFIIPLSKDDYIEVNIYHNLTPERGWLSSHGVGLSYYHQKGYKTEVDPGTADRMIHLYYFNCFTDRAIQQAIRGEKYTWCTFKEGHKGQVQSLQLLALVAYTNGIRKRSKRTFTRMAGNLGSRQGAMGRMATRHAQGSKRRSQKALWNEHANPSMELLCRGGKET